MEEKKNPSILSSVDNNEDFAYADHAIKIDTKAMKAQSFDLTSQLLGALGPQLAVKNAPASKKEKKQTATEKKKTGGVKGAIKRFFTSSKSKKKQAEKLEKEAKLKQQQDEILFLKKELEAAKAKELLVFQTPTPSTGGKSSSSSFSSDISSTIPVPPPLPLMDIPVPPPLGSPSAIAKLLQTKRTSPRVVKYPTRKSARIEEKTAPKTPGGPGGMGSIISQISSGLRGSLRKSSVQKSPGGTPVRAPPAKRGPMNPAEALNSELQMRLSRMRKKLVNSPTDYSPSTPSNLSSSSTSSSSSNPTQTPLASAPSSLSSVSTPSRFASSCAVTTPEIEDN